jgi:hypothetical protein
MENSSSNPKSGKELAIIFLKDFIRVSFIRGAFGIVAMGIIFLIIWFFASKNYVSVVLIIAAIFFIAFIVNYWAYKGILGEKLGANGIFGKKGGDIVKDGILYNLYYQGKGGRAFGFFRMVVVLLLFFALVYYIFGGFFILR